MYVVCLEAWQLDSQKIRRACALRGRVRIPRMSLPTTLCSQEESQYHPSLEGREDKIHLLMFRVIKGGEKTLGRSLETSCCTDHLVLWPCSPRALPRMVRNQTGSPERARSTLRASCRGRGCLLLNTPVLLSPVHQQGRELRWVGEQVQNQRAVS